MPRSNTLDAQLRLDLTEYLEDGINILNSYDFSIDECELNERDCVKEHGESLFRIYQLIKEFQDVLR